MNKVLSFIEWADKRKQKLLEDLQVLQNSIMPMNSYEGREKLFKQFVVDLTEAHDFYNQKFDVSMLVNPEIATIHFEEAEQKRLFEGWVYVNKCYSYRSIDVIQCDFRFFIRNRNGYGEADLDWKFSTLNEFITVCNSIETELQWNPNNQTIKNLNLNQ